MNSLRHRSRFARRVSRSLTAAFLGLSILGCQAGPKATREHPQPTQISAVCARAIAKTHIASLHNGLEEYAILNGGRFPETLEVLVTKDSGGNSFLEDELLPTDPWGRPYIYEPPTGGGYEGLRVFTLGADGLPGGDGEDADIDHVMARNSRT